MVRPRTNVRDFVRTPDPDAAQLYRDKGWWRDELLSQGFYATAARTPDKVAIVNFHADGRLPEVLSYGQLQRWSERFAGGLLGLGVEPGEVVSFQLPNWWQFAAINLACLRIGAVANPIMPILRRREVGFILDRLESRVCIVPDHFRGFAHADMLADLKRITPSLEHVFVIGDEDVAHTESFKAHFCDRRWEDQYSPEVLDRFRPSPDDPVEVMYTSGTTGEPKGVVHNHNTLDISLRVMAEGCALTADDVVLMASPVGHQTGYLYGMLMPLKYGMKVVYQDAWDPDAMLRIVADEAVTFTMGSTAFVLDACASAASNRDVDLSSLRVFYSAGAPIPPHAVEAARTTLGTKLIAGWGMTEIGLCTSTTLEDSDEKVTTTDGVAIDCVDLKLADFDGTAVPVSEPGRLLVRAASQHLAYIGRDDLYDASFHDGWFDTGDLARMDEHGYIRITGRSKDIIIRGGENIPVAEVEALLYTHPKVREVAVVAVPDDRLGERACAVVVADGAGDPTLSELTEHLAGQGMAKQFWPERLELRRSLPKTASGKIQKVALREELTAGADA
jgi:cyclohexanecarboxylate-CoA ligase